MQNRLPAALSAAALFVLSSCSSMKPEAPPRTTQVTSTEANESAAGVARRTGFATADDGTRIYYEASGSGPAIVLVHGLGGNHAVWFQQVASLARRYTVVTLSQRGFAPSGGDHTAYPVDRYVRDLVAVMDAAGVARAVIVGQSMGGWTALGAALHAPERVSALVLADTTGGISDKQIAAHLRKVTAQAEKLRATPPPLGVHPALAPAFSRDHPDLGYLYQTLSTFGSPPPDVIANHLARSTVSYREVKNVRVPTLFVVGTEDRLFPPDLVRHAASGIRKVEVSELGGSGHSAYFENPGLWNAVVRGFIDRRVR